MNVWSDRILIRLAAVSLGILLLAAASPARAADANQPQAATPSTTPTKAPPVKKPYDPHTGTSTGLPLPRFVSLRADAVNLRVGPGDQYPIQWVYHRAGLPVEVLREFDVWRLVIDSEGTKGWMHEATLVGTRHFVINGPSAVTLFRQASIDAAPAAQLMPGVVGLIERCTAGSDWCRVRVAHQGGWLERSEFWGTLPDEQIPAK